MRQFLFELLNENKEKFTYMLGELSPRDFITVYMKLAPYIIAMRHLQQFDVSEISRETEELVKDLIDGELKKAAKQRCLIKPITINQFKKNRYIKV